MNQKNGWRTAGLLTIGALIGVGLLIATAKVAKQIEEKAEADDYVYEPGEPPTRWERLKNWICELLGLELSEYDDWKPSWQTVFLSALGTALLILLVTIVTHNLLPAQTFDLTLSPVRVWVTKDEAATPKANVTIIASGNTVEQDGAQLEYIVTDMSSGKVIETGDFEQRLYADIGFDRGQAAATYRIDVILMRQGHDPSSKSRTFTVPSAAALPTE